MRIEEAQLKRDAEDAYRPAPEILEEWFAARYGVLPAFGAFTGTAFVRLRHGDQVFVIADGEVLKVS
jgi:hypothetical protein